MRHMPSGVRPSFVTILLALLWAWPATHAANVAVDCNAKKGGSINAAIAALTKQGPHTITISGACREAVHVEDFDNLTFVGTAGASITAPASTDGLNAVEIWRSRTVTLHDLTINGDGMGAGVVCTFFSDCVLYNVTVQGAYIGVNFARATGMVGDNSILQNNIIGLSAIRNSHVRVGAWPGNGGAVIRNNGSADEGGDGINIDDQSYVDLFNSTVQDNDYGNGIWLRFDSFLGLYNSTITGNGNAEIGGAGIRAESSSTVRLRNTGPGLANVITSNAESGIMLGYLTFLQVQAGRTITGNGQPDVNCLRSTATTAGTGGSATPHLGGGTTNCTEPAP